jgi:hypothetical protein
MAVVAWGWCCAGSVQAQQLQMTNSRTYVMDYAVNGNIAVPVMGVATDKVTFGANVPVSSAGAPRPPLRVNEAQVKAIQKQRLDAFFSDVTINKASSPPSGE